jgi:hypothetical protein
MDRQKALKLVRDAECHVKDVEVMFPKARNKLNTLGWTLKAIKEEISKPDEVTVVETPKQ